MRFNSTLVALAVCALPAVSAAQTLRLGAHYGVNLTEGHWEQERLGVQGEVRVVGPLALSGAVSRWLNYPRVTGFSGSAWQLHANARLRAPGTGSVASVGYGFVVLHQAVQVEGQPSVTASVSDNHFTDTAVLGMEAPLPYVRPFADLYLMGLLDHEGQVAVNLLMGLQVPMRIP